MYNIELLENEKIESIDDDANLLVDGSPVDIVIVMTNKRLIILKNVNDEIDYKETLKFAKGVSFIPEYESLSNVKLTEIKSIQKETNGFYKCILANTNYFMIKSEIIVEK